MVVWSIKKRKRKLLMPSRTLTEIDGQTNFVTIWFNVASFDTDGSYMYVAIDSHTSPRKDSQK